MRSGDIEEGNKTRDESLITSWNIEHRDSGRTAPPLSNNKLVLQEKSFNVKFSGSSAEEESELFYSLGGKGGGRKEGRREGKRKEERREGKRKGGREIRKGERERGRELGR